VSDVSDQYRDSSKLAARANFHIKYGAASPGWNIAGVLNVASGQSVLDIGCGPARIWGALAKGVPEDIEITLADLSPGMVEEAVARVRPLRHWRRVQGQVADVCALPFGDGVFDCALSMHMLYHASDTDKAVAELARVLKPGGRLFVTTNGNGNMREMHALSGPILGTPGFDTGSAAFTLERGAPILRRHFATVETVRHVDELRVTDAKDIVRALTSFPPGDIASPQTLAELDAALAKAFAGGNGIFPITRIAGYMLATKANR
jgi:SAM-dependent methyltransferase